MNATLQKYLIGKSFTVVEAELRERVVYHAITIKRIGNKIRIVRQVHHAETMEALQLDSSMPCGLIVTGKGVIYKTVQADRDATMEQLLSKAIPHAQSKTFITSSYFNDRDHLLTIARKDKIEEISNVLNRFTPVVALTVGAGCISEIVPLLKNVSAFGHHRIQTTDTVLQSLVYNDELDEQEPVNLNGESIHASCLLSFAFAVRNSVLPVHSEIVAPAREDFLQHQLFRSGAKFALIYFLVVLLLNFLTYNHYHSLADSLQQRPETGSGLSDQLKELRSKVSERKSFLETSGLMNNTPFAWYADQLAHSMPDGIQLSRLAFAPRMKLPEEDTIAFATSQVELAGNCSESSTLNSWLQLLKTQQWIRSATIRTYEKDPGNSRGDFILDLQI